jgi:hypothetical protein
MLREQQRYVLRPIIAAEFLLIHGAFFFSSKIFSHRPRDRRTHADRTQILVDAFAAQLESMTDAYLTWGLAMSEKDLGDEYALPEDSVVEETRQVMVVDLFGALEVFFVSYINTEK